MAARNVTKMGALDREVVALFGGGTGASAANMTAIKGAGITSITWSATGTYVINLTDKWNTYMFFSGTVTDTTSPDDWEVVVSTESVASAKTVTITTWKGGLAADLTTDEKLKFMLVLSNTAQPPSAR